MSKINPPRVAPLWYNQGMAPTSKAATAEQEEAQPASRQSPNLPDHPVAHTAGLFAEDPLWEDFIEAMKEERLQRDIAEGIVAEEVE